MGILGLAFLSVTAWAADPFGTQIQKVEVNDPAFKSLEVGSRGFRVVLEGEEHFGMSATAAFETRSIDALGEFGLVQNVRGCKIRSCKNPDGTITRTVDQVVPSFGDHVPWSMPDWIVDSIDSDPVYNSFDDRPDLHRIAAYRWNTVPGSFDRATEKFFGNGRPREARLYVTDTVGVAYQYSPTCASNVSLQFRVCAYRLADVPVRSTRDRIEYPAPLACLDWGGSHVFNHTTGKFRHELGDEIDPVCGF